MPPARHSSEKENGSPEERTKKVEVCLVHEPPCVGDVLRNDVVCVGFLRCKLVARERKNLEWLPRIRGYKVDQAFVVHVRLASVRRNVEHKRHIPLEERKVHRATSIVNGGAVEL